jgi:5-oxoprolinase (ATP-hydrolysing) subunit A
MDLNCDMGEGLADADVVVMPLITSANVACGYHAGDPGTMERTVALARAHGVAVGAHPGYPDRAGFGRRQMAMSPEQVELTVLYQIGALAAFCRAHGLPLVHVKAHGALYNAAAADQALAHAIARAAARFDRDLILVGLASSETMAEAAAYSRLAYAPEAFAYG